MRSRTHDVVVVGGGVIGLACAYQLATDGVDTLVLERGLPGAEQTVRTGGGIRLCHSSVLNTQLSKLSLPFWGDFEENLGVDPRFKGTGHLFLSRTERSTEVLKEHSRVHRGLGIKSEMLAIDEVTSRWQDLDLDGHDAALFCSIGGYVNHHRVVQGLYHGSISAGAEIRIGERVTGLLRSEKKVVGVETTDRMYHAGHVVNCAGALAGHIARMVDMDLPIISRRHELLIVKPDTPIPDSLPWLIDMDEEVHLRPDGQGRALVGGFLGKDPIVDPERYDPRYEEAWACDVRSAASNAFGLLEPRSTIVEGWAGVYAGTPDYHPVIEKACPGLLTAAGFSGTGLMHAPAAGSLVSELVRFGEATSLDIAELGSARFAGQLTQRDSSGF